MLKPIAALALILLSGCDGTLAPPTIAVQQACLPMAAYTLAQEQAVSAELATFKPADPVLLFITDYGAMRAANRACLASNAPTKGTAK